MALSKREHYEKVAREGMAMTNDQFISRIVEMYLKDRAIESIRPGATQADLSNEELKKLSEIVTPRAIQIATALVQSGKDFTVAGIEAEDDKPFSG